VVVAGGTAGDFLSEYMAGGLLVILGLDRRPGEPLVGEWCGTGMHGGTLYLRGEVEPWRVASQFAGVRVATDEDMKEIVPHVEAFCEAFSLDASELLRDAFTRIAAISHRPYGAKYAA
jgi:glutamate synthase domain-containing protein 3